VTLTTALEIQLMSDVKNGLGLDPNSASPVLKTPIIISIQPDFPYELKKEEFTVNATSQTNSTNMRRMNVIAVDDS